MTGAGAVQAFRLPGDAEKYPPPAMLPQSGWTVERYRKPNARSPAASTR